MPVGARHEAHGTWSWKAAAWTTIRPLLHVSSLNDDQKNITGLLSALRACMAKNEGNHGTCLGTGWSEDTPIKCFGMATIEASPGETGWSKGHQH